MKGRRTLNEYARCHCKAKAPQAENSGTMAGRCVPGRLGACVRTGGAEKVATSFQPILNRLLPIQMPSEKASSIHLSLLTGGQPIKCRSLMWTEGRRIKCNSLITSFSARAEPSGYFAERLTQYSPTTGHIRTIPEYSTGMLISLYSRYRYSLYLSEHPSGFIIIGLIPLILGIFDIPFPLFVKIFFSKSLFLESSVNVLTYPRQQDVASIVGERPSLRMLKGM